MEIIGDHVWKNPSVMALLSKTYFENDPELNQLIKGVPNDMTEIAVMENMTFYVPKYL